MGDSLPEAKYEVTAYLRLKGGFKHQMDRAAKGLPKISQQMVRMGMAAEAMGQRMSGAMRGLAQTGKVMAMVAGGAAAAGMFSLAKGGAQFAYQMEQAKLNIGTMFQLFGQAQGTLGKSVTSAEAWRINLALAERSMENFMKLQRQTPAGAADLVTIYQTAAAGLAQTGAALERQEKFVTSMSLLGPALSNDFRQIGNDVSRMLTGGAGMDVRTWTILRTNIAEAAKALGFIQKGITDADKLTKAWNMNLTAPQKLKALEMAISRLGPEIKETFGKSMGGLLTTTASNMKVLKRALMQPLYDGFRAFLEKANKEGSGIFGTRAMDDWSGILGYFGTVMSKAADTWYGRITRAADYLAQNWSQITEHIKAGFEAGVFIIKALLAKAIFSAMAGPLLSLGGKAMQKGPGAVEGLKDLFMGMGAKRVGIHRKMSRGVFGKPGGGAAGMFGRMVGGVRGRRGGASSGLMNLEKSLLLLGSGAAVATIALGPMLLLLSGLTIALGVVGVILGGVAAYMVERWDTIAKSIHSSMEDTIKPAIRGVVIAGLRLWYGLVSVGEAMMGGGKSIGFLTGALGMLEGAIKGVAFAAEIFLNIAAALRQVAGVLKTIYAGYFLIMSKALAVLPIPGAEGWSKTMGDLAKSFADSAADSFIGAAKLYDVADRFGEIQEKGTAEITDELIKGKVDAIAKGILDIAGGAQKKRKVPTSGVHIENNHMTLDLRQQDPDRIMSAFIRPMEKLANKRVQSFEMLPQGV